MAALVTRRALTSFRLASSVKLTCKLQTQTQSRQISFSKILANRLYSEKHEWLLKNGNIGTVGISQYAQDQLGEIVYAETPEVGAVLEAGDIAGCLESVKAASDIFSPVGGKVTEVNEEVIKQPGIINTDPYEGGWLYKLELASGADTSDLMNEAAYTKYLEGLDE